jgi:dGTPase
MKWAKLISDRRLGLKGTKPAEIGRSIYQRDYDAIIFSSSFRRLQDKAQVFPLAKSDYVRTRLTHSLEVSCVGRSLGYLIGEYLRKNKDISSDLAAADIGSIVAAACLAHDIGNPPFGHNGEKAIQGWFKTKMGQSALKGLTAQEKADFENFEGNAQGFRILTRLQNTDNEGGLQLTCATLATFTKYPRPSKIKCGKHKSHDGRGFKKHGYFVGEAKMFEQVAGEVGLTRRHSKCSGWFRHPLVFLVEAADDICYGINDIEDGYRLRHISFDEAVDLLKPIPPKNEITQFDSIAENEDKISYLRAKAIKELIIEVADSFKKYEKKMLSGEFDSSLTSVVSCKEFLREIEEVSLEKIYTAREVLEVEIPGYDVLGGLLEAFVPSAEDLVKGNPTARSSGICRLLPKSTQRKLMDEEKYDRLLRITDYVSGMTDSYAVSLYKQIKGISLPQS